MHIPGGEGGLVDCVFLGDNKVKSVFSCGLSIFSSLWKASYSLIAISDVSFRFITWN